MNVDDLLDELRRDDSVQTGSGATSAQVAAAESTLGLAFPDSYRRFLTEIGWASEVFGLGDDVPGHLELVRLTQDERTEFRPHIPPHLVPVHNDGGGNHYCLDTGRSTGSECPIVFWDHEHERTRFPRRRPRASSTG